MSEGFQGLGLTVGELARGGTGFLDAVRVDDLATEEEDSDLAGADVIIAGDVTGRRVGVDARDVDFGPGIEGLEVGVEGLAVDLELGVEDLGGTAVLVEVGTEREVGVADLDGLDDGKLVADDFDAAKFEIPLDDIFVVGLATEVNVDLELVNVGRPVGVEDLDPPEEEDLLRPEFELFPGDNAGCLDVKLLLAGGGSVGLASLDLRAVGRAFGLPRLFATLLCEFISNEGKRGVPGGVKSQS